MARSHLLLISILLLVIGTAQGAWLKAGEFDDATYYTDPSTVRKNGDLRKVIELMDLRTPDEDGGLSFRVLAEYDCKEKRMRTLGMTAYAGPMATGKTVYNISDAGNWATAEPGTTGEVLLRSVCEP